MLDTGVSQVPDLGNRVVARVDLTPDHDGEDYFGHGTHLAGIVAGSGVESDGRWKGVAPRARIVSVKVAGADGSTDVSVVIAGLQWVASHRSDYNIRVLNLAFGTDGQQTYSLDPLNYAVEQVWFSGVLVVVSAGNRGSRRRRDQQARRRPVRPHGRCRGRQGLRRARRRRRGAVLQQEA